MRKSIFCVLLVLASACSSSGNEATSASLLGPELLGRHLHPDVEVGGYADFGAVRAGLDLEEASEDPADRGILADYVAVSAPIFSNDTQVPLAEAVDLWAVQESIASQFGLGSTVTLTLRTEQSWDDIAAALERAGYVDRGDGILTTDARVSSVSYTAVGSVDGLVLAGQDGDVIADRLTPSDSGPTQLLSALAVSTLGPIRAAAVLGDGGCGQIYIVGTEVPSQGGTWALPVGPAASVDRVNVVAGEEWGSLRTSEPVLEDDLLSIDLTRAAPSDGIDPSAFDLLLASDATAPQGSLYQEYRCP